MYFDVPEAYVPNLCTLPLLPAARGCIDMPALPRSPSPERYSGRTVRHRRVPSVPRKHNRLRTGHEQGRYKRGRNIPASPLME